MVLCVHNTEKVSQPRTYVIIVGTEHYNNTWRRVHIIAQGIIVLDLELRDILIHTGCWIMVFDANPALNKHSAHISRLLAILIARFSRC